MNTAILPNDLKVEMYTHALYGVMNINADLLMGRWSRGLAHGMDKKTAMLTVIQSHSAALGSAVTDELLSGVDSWLERHAGADEMTWLGDEGGLDA